MGIWFRRFVRGCSRPGRNDGDFVERADFLKLSNGILVFRMESGMSRVRKSKGDVTHDVAHQV